MIKHLKTVLNGIKRLINISRDLSLSGKLQPKSDDAVAEALESHPFVKAVNSPPRRGQFQTSLPARMRCTMR
jgi:hypothetical protein